MNHSFTVFILTSFLIASIYGQSKYVISKEDVICEKKHTSKPNETFDLIAKINGITLTTLKGLNPQIISESQCAKIDENYGYLKESKSYCVKGDIDKSKCHKRYTTQPADNIHSITNNFKITIDDFINMNPNVPITGFSAYTTVCVSYTGSSYDKSKSLICKRKYTSKLNETFDIIASVNGITLTKLKALNPQIESELQCTKLVDDFGYLKEASKIYCIEGEFDKSKCLVYTAKRDDNIYTIIDTFEMTIDDFLLMNPNVDIDFKTGTNLCVTGKRKNKDVPVSKKKTQKILIGASIGILIFVILLAVVVAILIKVCRKRLPEPIRLDPKTLRNSTYIYDAHSPQTLTDDEVYTDIVEPKKK